MDSARLLIVDDDSKFCRLVAGYLNRFGYRVDCVHDGKQGLQSALRADYAAVILDVMMPKMNGWDVLRELRKESQKPVLMLTGLGEEQDRIAGLEIGADDYLPKSASMRELLARLRALLRRSTIPRSSVPEAPAVIEVGELRIEVAERVVTRRGRRIELTTLEFDLLTTLAEAHPRVKTREQLMLDVSDRDLAAFDRAIDMRIAGLRRKLGDDARSPTIIETVRGVGYRLGKQ